MRWFRFYNDAMRHPKVAQLSDAHFRLWVELLCVASENDGRIPNEQALKTILRRRLDHLQAALRVLLSLGLMDPLGDGYTPHGWSKRQYKSDSSTERSRLHREKRNVAATVDATAPDTDTDTDEDKNTPLPPKGVSKPDDVSDDCWQAFKKHRAKHGPISDRVIAGFRREAEKAGWTLEAAMDESIVQGWRGFKADYVKKGQGNGNRNSGNSNANAARLALEKLGLAN